MRQEGLKDTMKHDSAKVLKKLIDIETNIYCLRMEYI